MIHATFSAIFWDPVLAALWLAWSLVVLAAFGAVCAVVWFAFWAWLERL